MKHGVWLAGLAAGLSLALAAAAAKQDTDATSTGHPVVHPHRGDEPTSAAPDKETLKRLEALGYAEWTDVELTGKKKDDGVVFYDESRAYDGINLYKSRPRHEAHLMDMRGRILHTWRAPDEKAPAWDFVELTEDGHLLASAKFDALQKLDWESNVVWSAPIAPHHDLDVDDDGRIYVFTKTEREHTLRGEAYFIEDNDIAILSPAGTVERRIPLWDLFSGKISKRRLNGIRKNRAKKHYGDVFHANSIELLDRDVPGVGKRGQALISIRELDTIAVIDLDSPRVVWSWGAGVLDRQHHPSLLDSGRMLIFDNGRARKWSRVLEMDPVTRALTWELRGKPRSALFTGSRGSTERLPNGNTLVVESAKSRVFEVTPSGEIVWDFINPDLVQKKGKTLRANIYRMPRLEKSVLELLPAKEQSPETS